ncbi:enoyl-CoA hydratase-related protein [Shouchella sp. JSM 1781072]|uniref:enoyl-CoA hydratase-related protein n=1 Tax=Shouchella sp. JSM 1781072 TaxID=3344581 RepID=UPI0035C02E95
MSEILYEERDGLGIITLNRPTAYNALTSSMLQQLKKQLSVAEKSASVRCVVLTGAGNAFCSGQDLHDVSEGADHGEMLRQFYAPVIQQMKASEKPLIANVNGVAAGAGFSLALACDFRLLHEKASFINAFIHVGLVPDSGNLYFLRRLIGEAKTIELAMLGEKVSAKEAERLNLATRVYQAEDYQNEALAFAKHVATLPTKGLAFIKRGLNKTDGELNDYLEMEAQLQRLAGETNDHLEGIQAFKEKRKPMFNGY